MPNLLKNQRFAIRILVQTAYILAIVRYYKIASVKTVAFHF